MRDWGAMSRASLGILNQLDWFMSSVWTVLDGCPIEKDRQADIDKLMSASGIAVNQLAHIQMRGLASNATVRREAILESSVLDMQGSCCVNRVRAQIRISWTSAHSPIAMA